MNFRTIADLNATILKNLYRIPNDIDVVVGVPRSGLMAGSLVALALNLPLADVAGFVAGRLLASGKTRAHQGLARDFTELRNVLVVDDSARTGTAITEARALLTAAWPDKRFTYCAVYGLSDSADGLDLIFETVPLPRVFQWNVMHHIVLADACVDIDGVLCRDPNDQENDDGPGYLAFLRDAEPLHRPTQRIGTLVTSRLEKYRPQTEAWLAAQNIEYDNLVMLDLPDMATRRRLKAHGSFKAQYYRKSRASLFIESELAQAETIARISGKPALSMDGPRMCYPDALSVAALAVQAKRVRREQFLNVRKAIRLVIGETAYASLKQRFVGR